MKRVKILALAFCILLENHRVAATGIWIVLIKIRLRKTYDKLSTNYNNKYTEKLSLLLNTFFDKIRYEQFITYWLSLFTLIVVGFTKSKKISIEQNFPKEQY